jgi:heat shock protein HtpX
MFAWGKRIFLFMALNALVVVSLSLLTSVLGIRPYLTSYGLDYESLMGFCLVWGMGGAFISLLISRIMAKMMMGVRVIDASRPQSGEAQWLLETVHSLSRSAGISVMPEVGIYESPEVNAFATGPTKNRALVAVSTGLLQRMNREQVEGVLGHEVAHVANGDMVTMTLVQGVVNAFVMFLSRVIAFAIAQAMASRRDGEREGGGVSPLVFHLTTMVLELVFMLLGSMLVAAFSRFREFRADAGGARLAGRDKMISALQGLQRTMSLIDTEAQPAVQSMKISGKRAGFWQLFSTHPSLEERILRLETATHF